MTLDLNNSDEWENSKHKDLILKLMVKLSEIPSSSNRVHIQIISTILQKSENVSQILVEEMEKYGLIDCHLSLTRPLTYSLSSKGKRYLYEKQLLK